MVAVTDVGVVIPARNEESSIGAAVSSVALACARVATRCTIVVVDDASTDRTSVAAQQALTRHDGPGFVISVRAGRASRARAAGEAVFSRTIDRPRHAWLLSMDADSIVRDDWVECYLAHAELGALAVAGVVELINDDDGRRIGAAWWDDYGATIAPDRTHPHVHAANLGVRLDVYRAAGGFADLARAEDIDLWRRIREMGHEPVADADLVVATSARLSGRVDVGFAAALGRLYGDAPPTPATVTR